MNAKVKAPKSELKPKPFVKWAGGKTKLVPTLMAHFPASFDRYFEPFLGGGALMFHLASQKPAHPIVGIDNNHTLIAAYDFIKHDPGLLIYRLSCLQSAYELANDKQSFYYSLREDFRNKIPKPRIIRVAQFLALNKLCFNGLYRVNSDGEFNVPYGKYKNPKLCDVDNILACSEALQKVDLMAENYGFAANYYQAKQGDFFYLDPPYFDTFSGYTAKGFNLAQHKALSEHLDKLNQNGCKFMISNSWTLETWKLYEGFNRFRVTAPRSISCNGNREPVYEILATNYDVPGKEPEKEFS